MENFLLPDMIIELLQTNRILKKFNFKDWISHSAIICGPELCKRNGVMKMRLATNIDGYPLRLALLFAYASLLRWY